MFLAIIGMEQYPVGVKMSQKVLFCQKLCLLNRKFSRKMEPLVRPGLTPEKFPVEVGMSQKVQIC